MWHVLLIKLNQAVVWMNSCLEQLSYHIKNWHHKKCRHHHNENIYWLVFNANVSSISAISLGEQILQINTSKKKLKGKKNILFRTYVIHWYKSNTYVLLSVIIISQDKNKSWCNNSLNFKHIHLKMQKILPFTEIHIFLKLHPF